MNEHDTIAAVSTAVSESGIGIIRISGEHAIEITDRIYRSVKGKTHLIDVSTHTIHYGYIVDPESGEVLDEVLVSVMRAPRSFTTEDTAEINCHGGVYAMKRVLEAVIHAGARPAQPGEFTRRAFLSGRIDLSQAEAIMDLISAKNEYALRSAVSQLHGTIRDKITQIRSEIILDTAQIESALDDPEHYDLEGFSDQLDEHVRAWQAQIRSLIASAEHGRLIREGISTVILGRPNAGKSSLMNRLLREERAIVTQIPGTTRDVLSETMQLGEITLNLMDTAGIRLTEDPVEKIGVQRAWKQAEEADLILYVVDSSQQMTEDDAHILKEIEGKKAIILLNKSDLPGVVDETVIQSYAADQHIAQLPAVLSVSMKEGEGLQQLEKKIKEMFYQGDISFNDQIVITNVRHQHLLEEAYHALEQVRQSIEAALPEDFYTIDLMDAYTRLGEIIGEALKDDLADEIFSRFCMGK